MNSKTIYPVKNKKEHFCFEPSMKTLSRILKTMVDTGPEAKTSLSIGANIQYTRLTRHIVWLEKKGFVESTIDKSRIKVGLTERGKEFAIEFFDD